jgi:hypothetical protein
MELIDCDNVQVPVDYETIIDELIGFREKKIYQPKNKFKTLLILLIH